MAVFVEMISISFRADGISCIESFRPHSEIWVVGGLFC